MLLSFATDYRTRIRVVIAWTALTALMYSCIDYMTPLASRTLLTVTVSGTSPTGKSRINIRDTSEALTDSFAAPFHVQPGYFDDVGDQPYLDICSVSNHYQLYLSSYEATCYPSQDTVTMLLHSYTNDVCRPVIASTVKLLVPFRGLVQPGTKNEKPVHQIFRAHWDRVMYWQFPLRNVKSTVIMCRIISLRNLVYRHTFIARLKQLPSIYVKRLDYNPIDEVHKAMVNHTKLLSLNSQCTDHLGGGTSKYIWKKSELNVYNDDRKVGLVHERYTLAGYSTHHDHFTPKDDTAVHLTLPLCDLCCKLPVRDMCNIAKLYNLPFNKNRHTRNDMITIVKNHVVDNMTLVDVWFKPIADRSAADKMKIHRMNKPKDSTTSSSEINRKACKKWRKSQKFPPKPPSVEKIHKIISNFVQDSHFNEIQEKGCAVCGRLSLAKNMTLLKDCDVDMSVLINPDVTRGEVRPDGSIIDNAKGPVLAENCDAICSPCLNTIRHNYDS